MRPFKLKSELVGDGIKVISLAEESFGLAHSKLFGDEYFSATWHMRYGYEFSNLTLSYSTHNDHVGIMMDFDYIGQGDGKIEAHVQSTWWTEIWESFMEKVRKPWGSWTEDEIMVSPMWCRYFLEDTGGTTDRIHTMMVMRSYENPEDTHVKGYFRSWEKSRQKT